MNRFRCGAVLSEWGRRLQAFAIDHADEFEVVLVRDRRAALQSGLDVLCLDPEPVWVDEALLAAARDQGVAVVGVYSSPAEERRWIESGVADRMSSGVPADGMTFLINQLRPLGPVVPVAMALGVRNDDGLSGRLPLVVGGPPGAGAREVAIAVASELAGAMSTVLVDLNECGGGVARRLGYAETPNVLTAVAIAAGGGDLAGAVAAPVLGRSGVRFDVISGLPSAAEWTRLSPLEAVGVLESCRFRWDAVVAVTSPMVEDLRRWGDRYGVSRAVLTPSVVDVVGVCEATPRGVVRFGEWLADAGPCRRVAVVVNKVPARSPYVFGEVRERLESLCAGRIEVIGWLPLDRRVARAEWEATLPRSGPFTRRARRLASSLSSVTEHRVSL